VYVCLIERGWVDRMWVPMGDSEERAKKREKRGKEPKKKKKRASTNKEHIKPVRGRRLENRSNLIGGVLGNYRLVVMGALFSQGQGRS
jgi:hypothetical protein